MDLSDVKGSEPSGKMVTGNNNGGGAARETATMMTYNEIRKHAADKGFKAEGGKAPTRKELEAFLAGLEGQSLEEQVLAMAAALEAQPEPVTTEEIAEAAGPVALSELTPVPSQKGKRSVCHGDALEARKLKYRGLVERVFEEANAPLTWGKVVKAVEEIEGVKVYSGMWHNCGDASKALITEGKVHEHKEEGKRATYTRAEPSRQLELPL